MIEIKLDTKALDALAEQLAELSVGLAVRSRLEPRRRQHRHRVSRSREMATDSGLCYGVVRQDVNGTKRANEADLEAHVTVAGEYHTLAEFDPRQTRKGISVRPWAPCIFGGGMTEAADHRWLSIFISG
jgi:hypothetical protein